MADLTLKDSEVKYLEFTIKDTEGNKVDLTGYSATLQVQKYGSSTLDINSACEITDATNGKVRYLYNQDLSPGNYRAEIEIYDGSSTLYITKTFTIKVIGDIE